MESGNVIEGAGKLSAGSALHLHLVITEFIDRGNYPRPVSQGVRRQNDHGATNLLRNAQGKSSIM